MIDKFDGKCGIIATFASSSNQIRCHYEMGHGGPCSFEKYRSQFRIKGGSFVGDWYKCRNSDGETHGFTQSVIAATYRPAHIIVNSDGDIELK